MPQSLTFKVLGDCVSFLSGTLTQTLSISVHFSMSLGHYESFFLLIGQNRKLNGLFPVSSFFSIVSNHHGDSCCGTFVSENFFWFFKIVKVVQVHTNDIFPRLGIFISLLSLFECSLGLLGFSILD
jgi:hypothetical protein